MYIGSDGYLVIGSPYFDNERITSVFRSKRDMVFIAKTLAVQAKIVLFTGLIEIAIDVQSLKSIASWEALRVTFICSSGCRGHTERRHRHPYVQTLRK